MIPAKKILVVEDEPDLLQILHLRLANEGYEVMDAKDGQEGLEVAFAKHPDLTLLDIMMPKVTGLDMLKSLRQDEWGKNAHVFILTSVNRSKEMSEALNYNVAKYINKADIKYEDLLWSIKSYLR